MTKREQIERALERSSVTDAHILVGDEHDIFAVFLADAHTESDEDPREYAMLGVAMTRIIRLADSDGLSDDDLTDLTSVEFTRMLISLELSEGTLHEIPKTDGSFVYSSKEFAQEPMLH